MNRCPPSRHRCARSPRRLRVLALALAMSAAIGGVATSPAARAASPSDLLATYRAQAGTAPQPAKGQALFNARHGDGTSCAGCHGAVPVQAGRHSSTGKPIEPLAPAADPRRFSDAAKAEKWFRRNCKDVLARECSAAEKADVLAWLMSLQP